MSHWPTQKHEKAGGKGVSPVAIHPFNFELCILNFFVH